MARHVLLSSYEPHQTKQIWTYKQYPPCLTDQKFSFFYTFHDRTLPIGLTCIRYSIHTCVQGGCGGNDHVFMPFTLPRFALPCFSFFFAIFDCYLIPESWSVGGISTERNFIPNVNPITYIYLLLIPSTYIHFFSFHMMCPGVSSHFSFLLVRTQDIFLCFTFFFAAAVSFFSILERNSQKCGG